MTYSFYVTSVAILQIYSVLSLLRILDDVIFTIGTKLSVLSLCLCSVQDFALMMTHVEYSMRPSSGYLFFILPALAYLVLFAVGTKMLFMVWKSQNMEHLEDSS